MRILFRSLGFADVHRSEYNRTRPTFTCSNNGNAETVCETRSKLVIKTLEKRQLCRHLHHTFF